MTICRGYCKVTLFCWAWLDSAFKMKAIQIEKCPTRFVLLDSNQSHEVETNTSDCYSFKCSLFKICDA